jgi:LmbE family N-acetylglucosaminyl deacetylase
VIAILSPHLDDAVLSCWHVLVAPDEDVAVVNVFAGVPSDGASTGWWDRFTGFDDGRDAMEARRDEDQKALARAGSTAINLDFLDRQYRSDVLDAETLVDALREWLPHDARLLAPAALGVRPPGVEDEPGQPHSDHVAVRDAALRLAAADGLEILLYADLPHANHLGWPGWVTGDGAHGRVDEAWRETLGAIGIDETSGIPRRLTSDEFSAKADAVRAYATQVGAIECSFGRRLDDPDLLGCEIVWRVS